MGTFRSTRFRHSSTFGILFSAAFLAACSGVVSKSGSASDGASGADDDDGDLIPQSDACNMTGPSPVRRLSRAEYTATLRDLFPQVDVGKISLTPDPSVHGFENRANKLYATENNVFEFSRDAIAVATKAVAELDKVISCAVAADEACGKTFVSDFGERAFRRPLTNDEQSRYEANFESIRKELGFKEAVQLSIEAMLQSVNFLYRMDLGETEQASDGRLKLTSWEVASRLSYLLWGSMPDADLFSAAHDGALESDAQILKQAQRMLKSERAKPQLVDFHRQWLDFEHINVVFNREGPKDPKLYPSYNEELRAAMREESDRFTGMVMSEGSHSLKELLTSKDTFVNDKLAAFYGVDAPAEGWGQVSLPEAERSGLLTRGAFLASHAHKFSGSPPLRAVYVMRRLMCLPELIPSPDADISEPVLKDGEDPKTNRQLFEDRVAANTACKGCHQLIDPIGFTFEHYDAIGKYRDTDNGINVDASGKLQETDNDGPVANAIELSQRLGDSRQVHGCMARQWLGFATGVDPQEDDCRVDRLTDVLMAAKGDVHTMLLALVKSPDFLTRNAP